MVVQGDVFLGFRVQEAQKKVKQIKGDQKAAVTTTLTTARGKKGLVSRQTLSALCPGGAPLEKKTGLNSQWP